MNIVGVNISHDTSVCLMQDGKIIFYLEEERLCKVKSFLITEAPAKIKTLDKIKNFVDKIDYLIISTYKREIEKHKVLFNDHMLSDVGILFDVTISEEIVNTILNHGILVDKIILDLDSHHLHHAHNAFYFSGFDSASVLVMDNSGAFNTKYDQQINNQLVRAREIESIYKFDNNLHKKLFKHYSTFRMVSLGEDLNYSPPNNEGDMISNTYSVGELFQFVTKFVLGLNYLDTGKVMGMSSYGDLDKEKIEWFSKYENNFLFHCNFLRDLKLSKIYLSAPFKEQSDFAKKLQFETKEYTIRLIQKAIDFSDSNNVVLSGGYFQNCVNNYAYLKAFPKINFYVDPICYDGGTAIGACLYVWHHVLGNPNTLQKLDNLYLGPE
jgi:carbamoyltransferase